MRIAPLKFFVNTAGRLSDGISLCLKEGLTSGIMLEYVYRNRASGITPLGKIIDRVFLSHPGWESIRQRKDNLVKLLVEAIEKQRGKGPALLVDVASGPALYIADAMSRAKAENVTAVCRDMDERWFETGRRNAGEKGVTGITFEPGNALDEKSFSSLPAAPDICVSSGFYDWIPADGAIKESMRIIHRILKPGGYFVFTNQAGHADMETTNGVFSDFNKKPLNMTTRPREKVNGWAGEAGFKIVKSVIDKWGYYSVTMARKVGSRSSSAFAEATADKESGKNYRKRGEAR
jgi:SAM-dependent methyltransferase